MKSSLASVTSLASASCAPRLAAWPAHAMPQALWRVVRRSGTGAVVAVSLATALAGYSAPADASAILSLNGAATAATGSYGTDASHATPGYALGSPTGPSSPGMAITPGRTSSPSSGISSGTTSSSRPRMFTFPPTTTGATPSTITVGQLRLGSSPSSALAGQNTGRVATYNFVYPTATRGAESTNASTTPTNGPDDTNAADPGQNAAVAGTNPNSGTIINGGAIMFDALAGGLTNQHVLSSILSNDRAAASIDLNLTTLSISNPDAFLASPAGTRSDGQPSAPSATPGPAASPATSRSSSGR